MKVSDILLNSSQPTDVSSLVKKLKVNKTTVYRQLDKLLSEKSIQVIELGDGKKRYESSKLSHHHHLICKKCGKIEDVAFDESKVLDSISKSTKFKIENHSIEFFGKCVLCI